MIQSVWNHVSIDTISRPTEMFFVSIIEGFPVTQSPSTWETRHSISDVCVDKTGSSQINLAGSSEILWPIPKAGKTCVKIGELGMFPLVLHERRTQSYIREFTRSPLPVSWHGKCGRGSHSRGIRHRGVEKVVGAESVSTNFGMLSNLEVMISWQCSWQ